jgi:hypothetical protein
MKVLFSLVPCLSRSCEQKLERSHVAGVHREDCVHPRSVWFLRGVKPEFAGEP